jgi:Gas vesicle synthesis protein GvpL/GvpF
MSLYVYAIADAPVALDDLHGVAGEPLRIVESSDRTSDAIAGDFTGAIASLPVLTAETLRAQDVLVRDLAARAGALLPARFGARFADEQALRQTLDDLAPRLDRALTRVRGREQMTVRLFHDESLPGELPLPHGEASDDATSGATRLGPGTRYMRQRAAEGRQLPAPIEELRTALADAIDDERVERGQSPVIGSIHHLIPRGSADRYRARLDEAAAASRFAASGIRLRVSGPSPAYAFAEADLS